MFCVYSNPNGIYASCPFSEFPFCGSQVRVLLFRECEWTGRRILFDSSAISKISASEQQPEENGKPARHLIEVVNGYAYYYGANAADGNSIGEMIYGSIAMTNRGTSLKVLLALSFEGKRLSNVLLH